MLNSPVGPRIDSPLDDAAKRPWEAPALVQLPRLTDLTLQTGNPINGGGGTGGGGTTVV